MSHNTSLHHELMSQYLSLTDVFTTVEPTGPYALVLFGSPLSSDPLSPLAASTKSSSPFVAAQTLISIFEQPSRCAEYFPHWQPPVTCSFLLHRRGPTRIEFAGRSSFLVSTGFIRKPAHPEIPAPFQMLCDESLPQQSPLMLLGQMVITSVVDHPSQNRDL